MMLRQGDPVETLVDADDIRDQIERVLEDVAVRGDHVIVEDHGEAVAVIVPFRMYEQWKQEEDDFLTLLNEAQQNANLSEEEAMELALEAVAAVRAERHAAKEISNEKVSETVDWKSADRAE